MNHFISVPIKDSSQIAKARRVSASITEQLQFSETESGKVAIAVTEAATNQIKFAGGGEILFRAVEDFGVAGIEVIAMDKGPGIANLQNCMRDGYSTSGTAGSGLGAIRRQSGFCDIYTSTGKGTIIYMQFWATPITPPLLPRRTEVGGVAVPIAGEEYCGDRWMVKQFIDDIQLLIADGLGHGILASEASGEAMRLFSQQTQRDPAEILKALHLGLKATRGAAAAVMEANVATGAIRYAGVGNTTGCVMEGETQRHMVSHNGTLGVQTNKVQEFTYQWPQDALLVFTTDGIVTQVSLKAYPGLLMRHCMVIAALIYRDFSRGRDDASVVVIRRKAA